VQVEDDHGGVLNYEIEEGLQEAIFNEVCPKHYNLAEDAPICKGALRGQFGYTTTSPSAQLVLDGLYAFPSNIDDATMVPFLGSTQVQSIFPPNESFCRNVGSSNRRR
jgi:hypothetical protein